MPTYQHTRTIIIDGISYVCVHDHAVYRVVSCEYRKCDSTGQAQSSAALRSDHNGIKLYYMAAFDLAFMHAHLHVRAYVHMCRWSASFKQTIFLTLQDLRAEGAIGSIDEDGRITSGNSDDGATSPTVKSLRNIYLW